MRGKPDPNLEIKKEALQYATNTKPLQGALEKATLLMQEEDVYCAMRKLMGIPILIPNTRKINHISIDELEQAMLTILGKCIGTTPEGLIAETVRAYGFNRAGTNIMEAMQKAESHLLEQGKVRITDGKISR